MRLARILGVLLILAGPSSAASPVRHFVSPQSCTRASLCIVLDTQPATFATQLYLLVLCLSLASIAIGISILRGAKTERGEDGRVYGAASCILAGFVGVGFYGTELFSSGPTFFTGVQGADMTTVLAVAIVYLALGGGLTRAYIRSKIAREC